MSSEMRWSKFWWGDWRSDPALRVCSLAARGLWMEMLALMHCAEPFGHLVVNGNAATMKQLAAVAGGNEREVSKLVNELAAAGVFSRTAAGVIYSRRMLRDKAASEEGRNNGKRGGNPSLKPDSASEDNGGGYGGGLTPPVNEGVKLEAKKLEEERELPPSPTSLVRSPRGSRLPDDWQPEPEEAGFAEALGLSPEHVAAQFRDYWHAKAGKDAAKLDWPATWRGWCRREAERRPTACPTARPTSQPRPFLSDFQRECLTPSSDDLIWFNPPGAPS